MRFARYLPPLLPLLACAFLSQIVTLSEACAQNIIVLVNDEPITSYDVAQRVRWMARTSGYGDKLKAILTGDAIKERFRQMMIAANPKSQAEAMQVAERIKKQLVEDAKTRVLTDGSGGGRKAAIDALIEDKLKLQAAKKLDIKITDKEVEETLIQRMGATSDGKKPDINLFFQQFESDGISRKTIKEIVRAQLAWRDVIRRQYGPRISSLLSSIPDNPKVSEHDLEFDVRVLRLAVDGTADQKAVSARMLEAENLKEKFSSCADLPKQAKLVTDATVRVMDKATLASFPKDIQPLIAKANEGQMTPPVLVGDAVESYAICRRGVVAKPNAAPAEQKPDPRQQEYDRFSRRYMQELKQSASIDYRGT